jgi:hypothetical protein
MSTKSVRWDRLACLVGVLLAGAFAGVAHATDAPTVCAFRFQGPEEIAVFASRLEANGFRVLDLSQRPLRAEPQPGASPAPAPLAAAGWFDDVCRPDLHCDVVVFTAEFGGRFFGKAGRTLTLQQMEEASCQARCDGLFHGPREVFLLACNTLASKDTDLRGPAAYLQVLLDHGFDRSEAERVVALRYGPLGPAFREALRRVFAGVPRIYGFESVAPSGEYSAPMLERYFRTTGDYRHHLDEVARDAGGTNRALLAAFRDSSLVQASGLSSSEPAAHERDLICALYDESRPVKQRLEIVRGFTERADILAFVPSIQVFVDRHPPDAMKGEERRAFDAIRSNAAARERVRTLVRQLDVSALQLELAHFAVQMGWMTREEFSALAVDTARQLLRRPVTDEVVDVMCELPRHEKVGVRFTAADLPDALFGDAEGVRLVSCLAPPDPRVSDRLARALDGQDPELRLWAAHALSRRLPLSEPVLLAVVAHLGDASPDVTDRLRWIVRVQHPLPAPVVRAVQAKDPGLAAELHAAPPAR